MSRKLHPNMSPTPDDPGALNAAQRSANVQCDRVMLLAKGMRQYRIKNDALKLGMLERYLREADREHRFLVQAEIWHLGLSSREFKQLCIQARVSLPRPEIAKMIGVDCESDEASTLEVNRIIRNKFVEFDAVEPDGPKTLFPLVYAVVGDNLSDLQQRVREAREWILSQRSTPTR